MALRTTGIEQRKGERLFVKEWMRGERSSRGGDGLGPVYNDTSCVACHSLGAPGGAGPDSKNVMLITAARNGCGPVKPLDTIHPGFKGSRSVVLHRYGTDPEYESWRRSFFDSERGKGPKRGDDLIRARIRELQELTTPGRRLREQSPRTTSMSGFSFVIVERNTPALFGTGRIDEIPSDVLVAEAARQPEEVRGRISRTREGRIGRFGWKAQVPSLHEFVRAACANELGLEVPGHSQAVSPLAPKEKGVGLDLTEPDCDALVAYVRALPAPYVVNPSGPQGTEDMRGSPPLLCDRVRVVPHAGAGRGFRDLQ